MTLIGQAFFNVPLELKSLVHDFKVELHRVKVSWMVIGFAEPPFIPWYFLSNATNSPDVVNPERVSFPEKETLHLRQVIFFIVTLDLRDKI